MTAMGIVTADNSVTIDGYGAGPNQSLEAPFGDLDEDRLHSWMFDHAEEIAAEIAAITEASAYIMGRNIFSPGARRLGPDVEGLVGRGWPRLSATRSRIFLKLSGGPVKVSDLARELDVSRQAAHKLLAGPGPGVAAGVGRIRPP